MKNFKEPFFLWYKKDKKMQKTLEKDQFFEKNAKNAKKCKKMQKMQKMQKNAKMQKMQKNAKMQKCKKCFP